MGSDSGSLFGTCPFLGIVFSSSFPGLRNASLLRPRVTFARGSAHFTLTRFQGSATLRCFALVLRSRGPALTPHSPASRAPQRFAASPSCYVRAGQRSLHTHP